MAAHKTNERDRVVIAKYLLEAHGKERQLETALQAQILLAKRPGLERALTDHLQVTRDQIRGIENRLAEIGQSESKLPGFAAAEAVVGIVGTVANKSLALAKGPLQALRGSSLADNELRNVRDCYWNEAEEIAHYRVIENVAEQIGDTKTADLAREYREQEEEMQRTLEGLLPAVVREVIETESPDAERDARPAPTRASSATTKPVNPSSRNTPNSAAKKPAARAKSTAARKTTSAAKNATKTPAKAGSTS